MKEHGNRYNFTKEFLTEEYVVKDKTAKQIGVECGCSKRTILVWLHKYNIKVRPSNCRSKTPKVIHWTTIVKCAKVRNLELDITPEYVLELYHKQGGRCAISGVQLTWKTSHRGSCTASLDRIDNSKGYLKGNVQWVHKHINYMKRTHSQEYFIELCKLVARNNGGCGV